MVVTINYRPNISGSLRYRLIALSPYRLNIFGFLGSEDLRGADGSTGNYGVQDRRPILTLTLTLNLQIQRLA